MARAEEKTRKKHEQERLDPGHRKECLFRRGLLLGSNKAPDGLGLQLLVGQQYRAGTAEAEVGLRTWACRVATQDCCLDIKVICR